MSNGLRAHAKPVLGLVHLVIIGLLITMSIAAYRKSLPWQSALEVTLSTPSAGLELAPLSDVKLQGIVVGEVREITSDGTNATLHLALDKKTAHLIPSNVDAQIVPKTLFGEKFVDLLLPQQPSAAHIAAGGVIRQSATSVEVGELFTHLEPVLLALNPQQLSVTLDAVARALQGRGTELGQTMTLLNTYLGGLNPHLPTLTHDLGQLATTADGYAAATPDLLAALDNAGAISRDLLVPQEKPLAAFLAQTITMADTENSVLARNAHDIITLTGAARPIEQVLADYSTEYPCLISALNTSNDLADHAFGGEGPFLKISIDLITQRPPYTYPADSPRNPGSAGSNDGLPSGVPSWAPHCAVVPPQVRGVRDIAPVDVPPESAPPPAANDSGGATLGLARALAGQRLELARDQVPGVAALLLESLVAGGQVTLS